MLVTRNVDAWSDGGAAQALTTSFVAGSWFKSRSANQLRLGYTVSGTAADSIRFQIEWSPDGGTTPYVVDVQNAIGGDVADHGDGEFAATGTVASHSLTVKDIPSNVHLRVSAKRDGGDATTSIIATASLFRE